MSLPRTNRALEAVCSQWAYSGLPQSIVFIWFHFFSVYYSLTWNIVILNWPPFPVLWFSLFESRHLFKDFLLLKGKKRREMSEMAVVVENKVYMKASRWANDGFCACCNFSFLCWLAGVLVGGLLSVLRMCRGESLSWKHATASYVHLCWWPRGSAV